MLKNWKSLVKWASLVIGIPYLLMVVLVVYHDLQRLDPNYFFSTLKYRNPFDLGSKVARWYALPCAPLLFLLQVNVSISRWKKMSEKNKWMSGTLVAATFVMVVAMFYWPEI